jgi:hypothetical protein
LMDTLGLSSIAIVQTYSDEGDEGDWLTAHAREQS